MKPLRLRGLPEHIQREIKSARCERGWSQSELGRRVGLTQRHISVIENGKIAPRYNTLIEILRVLEHELILVPREILPIMQAFVRNYRSGGAHGDPAQRPLYAVDNDEDEEGHQPESDNGGTSKRTKFRP